MRGLSAFAIGLTFGLGILIAGMGDPAKVLNFFDVAGSWDPSLAFVMGGALLVTAPGYRLAWARRRPLLAERFSAPERAAIDARLLGGAALFGLGWGMSGFCPGGAAPMLASGHWEPPLFVAAMLVGLLAAAPLDRAIRRLTGSAAGSSSEQA